MTGIGHNRPPVVVTVMSDVKDVLEPLKERAAEFEKAAAKFQIRSRFDVGDAGDILKLARRFKEDVDEQRLQITRPLDDAQSAAIAAVDEFWRSARDELDALQGRIDNWLDEQKRLADAQKAEQAREIQARRQDVPDMEPVPVEERIMRPVRGDLGAKVTPTRGLVVTLTEPKNVPEYILNSEKVRAAMLAVARDFAKHMDDIPGFAIERPLKGKID